MTIALTLLLIGSVLALDLLILITMKYIILMTNWIKDLHENSKKEYETILDFHAPKPNMDELKSKGSNVIYFSAYSKVK